MRREEGEQIASIAAAGVSNVECLYWDSPVEIGDICRVAVQFWYDGPAGTVKAYAAIGNKQWYGFDEISDSGWEDVEVSAYPSLVLAWVDIPITSAIDPAESPYDLYGKIDGLFPDVSPTYENVIEVSGVVPPPEPDYRNLKIISYSPTELIYGDTFRVTFRVEHIGEAESGKLHVAVGRRDTWFDEEPGMTVERVVSFPESMDWESKTINVSIPVEDIDLGVYEFYAKLMAVTGPDLFVYSSLDVLTILGVYEGHISKKELEYDGDRKTIPAGDIPFDTRGLVHIWAWNDSPTTQDFKIEWVVRDPDGHIVEDYSDWSYNHGTGDDHEFIGGRFDLDKEGEYSIEVSLLMNPDNPVEVDSYSGKLCTTTEAPPNGPQLSGVITEIKPLEFDFGDPIDLLISFNAYADDVGTQVAWETKITATLNGLSDSDRQNHIGRDGSRDEQPLHLGAMPNKNLSGEVVLEAKGLFTDWYELDRQSITVTVSGAPPLPCSPGEWKCVGPDMWGCIDGEWVFVQANAPECVLPPEKKFPWVAAALIGGGAAVAIAAAAKKPKKPRT